VNRPPPLNECLTVEQMAELRGVNVKTFRSHHLADVKINCGFYKMGHSVRVPKAKFTAYLASFYTPPNPAASLNLPR